MILTLAHSIPEVRGGEEYGTSELKEEKEEHERLRQEEIKNAEIERHAKYKKQDEERESMIQTLRDKVYWC